MNDGSSGQANSIEVSVRGQKFLVSDSVNSRFWKKVNAGEWEAGSFSVLDHMLSHSSVFIDCGAWIGPTTLYAASKGARVFAFECDPVAINRLKANLALNPSLQERVTLIEAGLAKRGGPFMLHTSSLGNSQSSIYEMVTKRDVPVTLSQSILVNGLDVSETFAGHGWLSNIDTLIKIDIEGAEYEILPALESQFPTAMCSFYVSFHPHNIVSHTSRPSSLVRLKKTLQWIDAFWDFTWWEGHEEGQVQLDKMKVLDAATRGSNVPSILFTKGEQISAKNGEI